MGQRLVKGVVNRPTGVWGNVRLIFTLMSGSFTPTVQYPSSDEIVKTGLDGSFQVSLWANEEGELPSGYRCKIHDDEPFEFTIPAGSGVLELSVLREAGAIAPGTPQWTSILSYVDTKIALMSSSALRVASLNMATYPAWTLSPPVITPSASQLFINGIKQTFPSDYVLSVQGSVLTYTGQPVVYPASMELYY